jgi:hypothetical protein
VLFRIGRKPDPWQPPAWTLCDDDSTFGNRFDDFNGRFRVLYASSSRLGCFIETLSRFRRAPEPLGLQQALGEITGPDDHLPLAHVPASWLSKRLMGTAGTRHTRLADIYSSEWLGYLRRQMDLGYFRHVENPANDFDLAALMSQQRRLTQEIASLVYDLGFNGIFYQSRHGSNLFNWALFEPFELEKPDSADLAIDDRDFIEALHRLNLGLSLSL